MSHWRRVFKGNAARPLTLNRERLTLQFLWDSNTGACSACQTQITGGMHSRLHADGVFVLPDAVSGGGGQLVAFSLMTSRAWEGFNPIAWSFRLFLVLLSVVCKDTMSRFKTMSPQANELNDTWREKFLPAHHHPILINLELCGVTFEWREDRSGRLSFVALGVNQQPIEDVILSPGTSATHAVQTLLDLVAKALEVDTPVLG